MHDGHSCAPSSRAESRVYPSQRLCFRVAVARQAAPDVHKICVDIDKENALVLIPVAGHVAPRLMLDRGQHMCTMPVSVSLSRLTHRGRALSPGHD